MQHITLKKQKMADDSQKSKNQFWHIPMVLNNLKNQSKNLPKDRATVNQSTPWRMNGKWSGNSFLLGSSSLANHDG
jgi:hypothetical protein